ncbi:MAG: hypothetical protein ABI592_05240 [Acidobacteriota bacterium]
MSSVPPPPGYAVPIPPPATPRSGCLKNGLIGCGIAALLILICLIAGMLYLRRNPQAITDYVMKQVEGHYAPDVTEAEKADLRAAYAAFRDRMKQGTANTRSLERVRGVILRGGPQNQISREQVRELTEAFREAAGSPVAPTPSPSPASPALTPSPGRSP